MAKIEEFFYLRELHPPPPRPEYRGRDSGDDEPGEVPSLEMLRAALAKLEPTMPEQAWWLVVVAVRSAYPGPDGFQLVDDWSSEARIANGQTTHLRADPGNWDRVQDARVDWRHVYRRAIDETGWQPHAGFTITTDRPDREGDLSPAEAEEERRFAADTEAYPRLAQDELPAFLQLVVDHLAPTCVAWDRDWPEMLAVSALSLLFPKVLFEGLAPNLWFLGLAEQELGKSRSLTEMQRVVRDAGIGLGLGAKYINQATLEGYGKALAGDRRVVYCDHKEYAYLLQLAEREHMAGIKGFLCALYDGEDWVYHRSKDEVVVERPYVVTVAATHQRTLARFLPVSDLTNGYASRFLFCAPRHRVGKKLGYRNDRERERLVGALLDHLAPLRQPLQAGWTVPADRPFHLPPALRAYEAQLGMTEADEGGEDVWYELEDVLDGEERTDTPGRVRARVLKVATMLELLDAHPQVAGEALAIRDRYADLAVRLVARAASYGKRMAERVGMPEDVALAARIVRQLKLRAATARAKTTTAAAGMTQRELGTYLKVSSKALDPAIHMLLADGSIQHYPTGRTTLYAWVRGRS